MDLITRLRIEKYNLLRNRSDSVLSIQDNNRNEEVYVLANGPSLTQSIEKHLGELKKRDIICVNAFPRTEFFNVLKPQFYVSVDPGMFDGKTDVYGNDESVLELIKTIKEKVEWKMYMAAPDYTRKTKFINEIKSNSNIDVRYYSDFCVGFECKQKEEEELYKLLMKDKICFPAQTVSCVAISLAILLGYKRINVLGLDMSMFMNHYVDPQTNRVYTKDVHFYDEGIRKYVPCSSSMGWFFRMYSIMFYQMEFINRYAKYNDATIINKSEFSFVDAFTRG